MAGFEVTTEDATHKWGVERRARPDLRAPVPQLHITDNFALIDDEQFILAINFWKRNSSVSFASLDQLIDYDGSGVKRTQWPCWQSAKPRASAIRCLADSGVAQQSDMISTHMQGVHHVRQYT